MLELKGYTIQEKINPGSHIHIFRAIRNIDKKHIVLKYIPFDKEATGQVTHLKNEYEILRLFQSERIITAFDLEKVENGFILVLEDGGVSLKELYIHEKKELDLFWFLKISIEIANALSEIHKKRIVHKDIKPANIVIQKELLTDLGKNRIPLKIIDFGISTRLNREETGWKSLEVLEGSLPYISPEQTGRVNRAVDYRTDFYSLGISFYELLTGSLPFLTNDPVELIHSHIAKYPPDVTSINKSIPLEISNIIRKLLEKDAEKRYQSAIGLKNDLEYCLENLEKSKKIIAFIPGQKDVSDVFKIPQKLYGRDKEIQELLSIFNETANGKNQLLLVSGYSGIGKSVFIHETHKPITEKKGYFLQGKFDQFQRNIPFFAILQAFKELMLFILTEPEKRLREWKDKLHEALGTNAQVIVDVIPELEYIIGTQVPVPLLGPTENQNRFNITFQNFISVFTRKDHPIVLFIDDLQWADTPSLNLIKLLMTDPNSKYLLFIGAYRDNEVDSVHPLTATIEEIKKSGSEIKNIHLNPLSKEHVNELVVETLHTKSESDAKNLTEVLTQKTGGNPFFLSEFLKTLYKEEVINFNYEENKWDWEDNKVLSIGITDNVVELMVQKLRKLPQATSEILSLAACLGNKFSIEMLSVISEKSPLEVSNSLWTAIEEGMLIPLGKAQSILQTSQKAGLELDLENLKQCEIKFQHDRVQQAAYSLIPEEKQRATHLQIGRLILNTTSENELDDKIFDIVNQFEKAFELINSKEERQKLSALNLKAGKKAQKSAAFQVALKYLKIAFDFLPREAWENEYSLAFETYYYLVESEISCGIYDEAIVHSDELIKNTIDVTDKSMALQQKSLIYTNTLKLEEATNVLIEALKLYKISMPDDPVKLKKILDEKYELVKSKVESIGFENILALPDAKDEVPIHIISLLVRSLLAFLQMNQNEKMSYLAILAVDYSINFGFTETSAVGFSNFSNYLFLTVQDFFLGSQYAKIALELSGRYKTSIYTGQTIFWIALFFNHFIDHAKTSIELFHKVFQTTLETGDVTFQSYCTVNIIQCSILTGMPVNEVSKLIKEQDILAQKVNYAHHHMFYPLYYQFIMALEGKTNSIGTLDTQDFSEKDHFKMINEQAVIVNVWLLPIRLILSLLSKNYKVIIEVCEQQLALFQSFPKTFFSTAYYFYYTLALIIESKEHSEYKEKISENIKMFEKWQESCPKNFEHQYYILLAQIADLNESWNDAIIHYQKGIESARENGFVQNEAIANELYAMFWLKKENRKIASLYLTEAHELYSNWGAVGKVKALEREYPELLRIGNRFESKEKKEEVVSKTISATTFASSTNTYSQMLDLTSILRASQALSGEIEYEKLLEKLIKIVIENAGAEKVVLISLENKELFIEAEGNTSGNSIFASPIPIEEAVKLIPITLIQYVARMKSNMVINDASNEGQFKKDAYVLANKVRSVLCSPISSKGKLVAIIYLENNLTSGAFTNERVETLNTLASQAAISIENAKLYANIENVTREKTRVGTEMEIAEKIQTSLLVEKPIMQGFEIIPYMETADEVGGDYYDVINDGKRDWLVIGDVSGHGVTAGLIMMMAQTSIHTIIAGEEEIEDKITQVDHVLTKNIRKMGLDKYMTLTLFLREGNDFYFTGLHQDILVYRKKEKTVERIVTEGGWLGLEGLFDGFYKHKFSVSDNDVILLYTDGVTEARHISTGEMLETKGLADLLTEVGELTPSEIKDQILELLKAYKTNDDVTFMVIKKNKE